MAGNNRLNVDLFHLAPTATLDDLVVHTGLPLESVQGRGLRVDPTNGRRTLTPLDPAWALRFADEADKILTKVLERDGLRVTMMVGSLALEGTDFHRYDVGDFKQVDLRPEVERPVGWAALVTLVQTPTFAVTPLPYSLRHRRTQILHTATINSNGGGPEGTAIFALISNAQPLLVMTGADATPTHSVNYYADRRCLGIRKLGERSTPPAPDSGVREPIIPNLGSDSGGARAS